MSRERKKLGVNEMSDASAQLWNSLPAHPRQTDIKFEQFKRLLNTFLFGCWDRGSLWL